jgi:small GTP-binding protein
MFNDRPACDEVVLLGRSNVGKSTLMRELTGHAKFTTGKKPGVTRSPNHYDWSAEQFMFTDLPGFGFMSGVEASQREQIKTNIVRYLETHASDILAAVLVVDTKSAVEIIDRHSGPDEIPHDIELFEFLWNLSVPTIVAANKMDKIDNRDEQLDELCDRLGLFPPWQQWRETVTPISAKRGHIKPLNEALQSVFHDHQRDDLLKFVS